LDFHKEGILKLKVEARKIIRARDLECAPLGCTGYYTIAFESLRSVAVQKIRAILYSATRMFSKIWELFVGLSVARY
jgi:hypothetical protein